MSTRPTIIIAASMPRSGSTWLFNAAKEIILTNKKLEDNFSYGWIGDFNKLPKKPVMLLKVHDFHPDLLKMASYVFYSFRDIRDVVASHARCFGTTPSLNAADAARANYEIWTQYSKFNIKYEYMMDNKLEILTSLAGQLSFKDINAEEILGKLENLKQDTIENKNFDTSTLYHNNHITNGRHGSWENEINEALEKEIIEAHKEWFEKHDYL